MPNITERISLLDELRVRLDNGIISFSDEFHEVAWRFVEAYDSALRQAALDGERYREEAEFWKNEAEIQKDLRLIRDKQCKALAEAMERLQLEFKANACECGEEWKDTDAHDICNNALAAYRQAVEQKEV